VRRQLWVNRVFFGKCEGRLLTTNERTERSFDPYSYHLLLAPHEILVTERKADVSESGFDWPAGCALKSG